MTVELFATTAASTTITSQETPTATNGTATATRASTIKSTTTNPVSTHNGKYISHFNNDAIRYSGATYYNDDRELYHNKCNYLVPPTTGSTPMMLTTTQELYTNGWNCDRNDY
ncbi:hypothetical protein HDV00_012518 [Rhizophlyctis rosea]|nr:hypothetical protein HDV00_012518 [Rhizophlyctis rosea]